MTPESSAAPAAPEPEGHVSACENCQTPLQGEFCHQCGQSSHNPLRHAGHALEEVFESFWHLDGRIFRTLRTLLSPGRLANAYLDGHRAPFVAPLRLFVIVSVVTFFFAQFAFNFGAINTPKPPGKPGAPQVEWKDETGIDFNRITTVDEVIRQRDKMVDDQIMAYSHIPPMLVVARAPIEQNIQSMQRKARERIAQIQPDHPALALPDRVPSGKPIPKVDTGFNFTVGDKPWDEKTNPLKVSWLPDFANHWLNKKIARARDNVPRFKKDPDVWKHAYVSAIPSALFVLVPVFALLLKIFYLGSGRLYLEHLVVALYSHVFLCLSVLIMALLALSAALLKPYADWPGWILGALEFAVAAWMPIYLYKMQRRVYGERWWLTLPKYLVLGFIYFILVTSGAVVLALTSLANA